MPMNREHGVSETALTGSVVRRESWPPGQSGARWNRQRGRMEDEAGNPVELETGDDYIVADSNPEQEYEDWSLVWVDGDALLLSGSGAAIAHKDVEKDPRFETYRYERDGDVAYSRIWGLAWHITGRFFATQAVFRGHVDAYTHVLPVAAMVVRA